LRWLAQESRLHAFKQKPEAKFKKQAKNMKTKLLFLVTTMLISASGCTFAQTKTVDRISKNGNAKPPKTLNDNQKATRQTNTPEQLVKNLYTVHDAELKTSNFRILSRKNRVLLDRYFDKNLADLIWRDLTAHRNDIGVIDFDLFYNTQDPQIKKLVVGKAQIVGDKATVPVTFTNSGAKFRISYLLALKDNAWKISNIEYGKDENLLKYFKEAKQSSTINPDAFDISKL
jgi:hypothetical protein